MLETMHFPSGITTRGARWDDVEQVTALIRAAEQIDLGEPMLTCEDLDASWRHPGLDLDADVIVGFDGSRPVAYAEVPGWRGFATVHPEWRGRGIGTALLAWVEGRAIARTPAGEEVRIGQTIGDRAAESINLFERHGYQPRHTSWILRLPAEVDLGSVGPPAGIEIRPYSPGEESRIFRVVEDAFNEWPNREPSTFEGWRATTVDRLDFDPSLLLVAVDRGEIVGTATGLHYPDEGWVEQLAVRPTYRHRGIARALLGAAFGEFRRRGEVRMGLSTDSRTGALDLYLRLGMTVESSFTHWSKLLRTPS
jgi:GNAT superfamily N-acetyltransferase